MRHECATAIRCAMANPEGRPAHPARGTMGARGAKLGGGRATSTVIESIAVHLCAMSDIPGGIILGAGAMCDDSCDPYPFPDLSSHRILALSDTQRQAMY